MATLKMFNTTGNEEVIFRDVYFLFYFLLFFMGRIIQNRFPITCFEAFQCFQIIFCQA